MIFTAQEQSIISISLQVTPDGKPKLFSVAEHGKATKIWEKLAVNTEKKDKVEVYVDGELELSSEERVFAIDQINQTRWGIMDKGVQTVLEKLSK